LSLKGDTVEYEIIIDFLEEICKPATKSNFQKMQQQRIKDTLKIRTPYEVIPGGKEEERNKFDTLLD
jgi:hypothetical protein